MNAKKFWNGLAAGIAALMILAPVAARAQASAGALQAAALANYKPVPIPKDPKAKTHIQFMREMKAWEHGLLKPGFDKLMPALPWKRDADRLFALYVQLDAPGTWELTPEVKTLRESLIKANCGDPYVQYCLGAIGEWTDDKAEQARGYQFMLNHPTPGVGGDYLLMKASYHVFDGTKNAAFKKQALDACIGALGRLLAADIKESNVERYIFAVAGNNLLDEDDAAFVKARDAAIQSASGKNTWLAKILLGEAEIKAAFSSRGEDVAANVTAQGMAGLQAHGEKGRALLEAAWRMAPDRPEAAGFMVQVANVLSVNPAAEMRLWFDRSVAAEMDYSLPYQALLIGLMPRWNGGPTHNPIVELGKEAMATGRYDSSAPINYINALAVQTWDYPKDLWRVPFRADDAPARLKEWIAGYEKTTPSVLKKSQLATLRVQLADWSGQYDDVLVQLKKLPAGESFDPLLKQVPGTPMSFLGRSRAMIEAEARAFTGPQRETLRQAEELELQGKIPQAVEQFKKAFAATASDQPVHDYLRDRIALALLDPISANYGVGMEGNPSDIFQAAYDTKSAESLEFLISSGFDFNQMNSAGTTPLYDATLKNEKHIVLNLLSKGANPNLWMRNRWTPLTAAANDGLVDMIDVLIAHGADVNVPYQNSTTTPLDLAVRNKKAEAVARLRAAGAKSGDPDALIRAVADKNTDLTAYLLDHGAKPNAARKAGEAPLHIAAIQDDVAMIDLLLKHGADVNVPNAVSKVTPLDTAAVQGCSNAMARLQAAGGKRTANQVSLPKGMMSGLHEAVGKGDMAAVRDLIAKGADVNAITGNGTTPLHVAVFVGNPAMVQLLLASGAKAAPLTQGGWGEAAGIGAPARANPGFMPMPIFAPDHARMPDLNHTPMTGNLTASAQLNALLQRDPDWKAWSAGMKNGIVIVDDNPPMPAPAAPLPEFFNVVASGNQAKVKELIAKGADVNVMGPGGVTPLHAAVFRGDVQLVAMLMNAGAKAKPLTVGGWAETSTGVFYAMGKSANAARFFGVDAKADADKAPASIVGESIRNMLPILNADPDWKAFADAKQAEYMRTLKK